MDQVKKILEGAQKNAFWIVSALTILLGIVGYYLSRTTMDKIFVAQSGKIDTQYSALNTIKSELSSHPNSKSHVQMDKIVKGLSDDVEKAWTLQYERQVGLMKWPPPSVLSDKIVAKVEKLRPIELTLDFPLELAKDPLVRGDLAIYARYFNDQFPALAQIIGCKWVGTPPVAGAGGMGGYGGMGGAMGGAMGGGPMGGAAGMGEGGGSMGGYGASGGANMAGPGGFGYIGADGKMVTPDLVYWPKAVQDAVIADVQTWRTPLPTTHDVLYTQENIWILEGLLNIIRNVNKDRDGNPAAANFQCIIKEIEFIRIGRSAVGRVGMIDPPPMVVTGAAPADGAAGGGEGGLLGSPEGGLGMGMAEMPSGGVESEGGDAGMGGGLGVAPTADPANGRYVDAAFKPITGDDLRTKMKSESPEDAYFAVAKRVPVRMRFKVDQRRLQTVLAQCGNANLMLEIRQIRIGDTAPAPATGIGGSGGPMGGAMGGMMGGGGEGSMGGYGGMGGGPGGMGGMSGMGGMAGGAGGGNAPVITSPIKSNDVPVEIYGVVYLFNPPSKTKLGLDKVTAETSVSDTVEVSADQVKPADAGAAPADAAAGQPNAGQPNAGQPNAGQPNAGQPNAGQPNAGQPNAGQPNPGQPNAGQPNAGQPNVGQPNPGQPNPGQPNPGQPNGQPNAGQPNPGQPNAGQPGPGVPPAAGGAAPVPNG